MNWNFDLSAKFVKIKIKQVLASGLNLSCFMRELMWSIFFMLALLRRASFWPPSMAYISVIITHILQITIFHICQSAEYILELCMCIQIQINQLIVFIEKLSPLSGFEPRTSRVPSRCATNWAIQAWIELTWSNNFVKNKFNWVIITIRQDKKSLKLRTTITFYISQTNFLRKWLPRKYFLQVHSPLIFLV